MTGDEELRALGREAAQPGAVLARQRLDAARARRGLKSRPFESPEEIEAKHAAAIYEDSWRSWGRSWGKWQLHPQEPSVCRCGPCMRFFAGQDPKTERTSTAQRPNDVSRRLPSDS